MSGSVNLPPVVSQQEWQAARDELLAAEKAHTRAQDALAARRRRLPMVHIDKPYVFDGPGGELGLIDMFEGRRQLIMYHFMLEPDAKHQCSGCSMFTDSICHLAHLHARDTSMVLVSRAPIEQIEPFRRRMGWTVPWYSSYRSDFNRDFGRTTDDGESFGLSVFVRDGDEVYRTYFTDGRGVESLGSPWSLLDLTPLGRQETWEDTPPGRPRTRPYDWWRLHDEYERPASTHACS